MALTLAQAKVGMSDKICQTVIDKIIRKSTVLNRILFDDTISPQGGTTLAYTYQVELTPTTAAGRAINSEYVAGEAIRTTKTTKLKIFGGSYQIDRALAATTAAKINEVRYQNNKKAEATVALFHNMFINGNSVADDKEFDGLKVLLKDANTEISTSLDIASMTDSEAHDLCNLVDELIAKLIRKPDVLYMNSKMKIKMKEAARRVGYLTHGEDAFGNAVDKYDGIEMGDLGEYWNGSSTVDIIPVRSADEYAKVEITSTTFVADGTLFTESSGTYTAVSSGSYNSATTYYKKIGANKSTDIYAVCYGIDELCALSPQGGNLVETHLPNFAEAKAVHTGDVEAIWGLTLKNTRAAGVIRGIVVKA